MNIIDEFFKIIPNLPMMPAVVNQVIALLGAEDVNLQQVVKQVSHDVAISAKLLRLANSSYYGSNRNIKTIEDAVALIGVSSLRTLVIASGITAALTPPPGMDLKGFWRHSLVTASIARLLTKKIRHEPETAYLAGLMHSIGQLLIHINMPQAAYQLDLKYKTSTSIECAAIETEELGINHCQVGSELARRWNFPPEIQKAIKYYTEPLHVLAGSYAPIIFIATHITYGLESKEDYSLIVESIPEGVVTAIGLPKDVLVEFVEASKPCLEEAGSFL